MGRNDEYDDYSGNDPISFVAAWALAKTGAKSPAEILLNRVLSVHGGYDPAYALLRELKGPDAIPQLDAIYASDQFEERPLIWKAVALQDEGKLEEAEAVVRKAISVDPSDGETHGGHRMYAYTVLGNIRAARGDAAGAAEYRSAVKAIRMAEEADKLAAENLLVRAIALYKESTQTFSDAYCIQSRLAVDLMEQGRDKEAEEHYRRAYELMPNSFGRVETHCMGCEHVFEGDLAQNIAERVFTSLAKTNPEKPQVHYLLGYLRFEQGRFGEAMTSYRKAVALDPEYLNAWKQMAAVSAIVPTTPAEQRTISDAILRLDPLQKHSRDDEVNAVDLKELWRRVDRAMAAFGHDSPKTAYALAASSAALAKVPGTDRINSVLEYNVYSRRLQNPGGAVAQDRVVQAIGQILDMTKSGGSDSDVITDAPAIRD